MWFLKLHQIVVSWLDALPAVSCSIQPIPLNATNGSRQDKWMCISLYVNIVQSSLMLLENDLAVLCQGCEIWTHASHCKVVLHCGLAFTL